MNARPAAQPIGLGTHSARGLVYLFAGASASKVVNFGAQVALTYLLSRSDFGIVSLAYTITTLIQVIEQTGVSDVLLRRDRFRLWAVPSFWLALAFGVASFLLIIIVAPIAAAIYADAQLVPILLILAPSSFANALMAVPRAQLGELRFRFLAALTFFSSTLRMALTVAFAAIGWGPYSFVVPVPLAAFAVAGILWWWVRPVWSPRLRFRRWRYLFGDSTRLLTAEFGRAAIDQSDYMMLGLFRNASIVGVYTVGFNFSVQMLQLLSVNLANILFPALTRLNEHPQAQLAGFLKAQRILALVGISSCLLQSAVAEPLTYLVLDATKWADSIIVMQVLSIGMATRMLAGSSFALLKSQGRFQTVLWSRWSFLAVQVAGMAIALALGGNEGAVAVVVVLAYYKMNTLHLHLSDDQGWRIEIKKWPKLTEYGGSTQVGGGKGGFYTQEQYKELVEYAADRFITVIPEIDMPGHTNAALTSYPELNCNPKDKNPKLYTGTEVGFSTLCTKNEKVYRFVEDVFTELAAITPGPYLHIGGDESHATAKQDYIPFVNRVQGIVKKLGKQVIGWDEIALSALQPNSVAQYWADSVNSKNAVKQGAKIMMSPAAKSYMDMQYDSTSRLGLHWAAYIEVDQAYNWNPATLVTGIERKDIIGVEAPLWTETIVNMNDIEYMVFPRFPGYAEIAWSPAAGRSWDEYKVRLGNHAPRMKAMEIDYYPSKRVDWKE